MIKKQDAAMSLLIVLLIAQRGGEATKEQIVEDCLEWSKTHGDVTDASVHRWYSMNKHILQYALLETA